MNIADNIEFDLETFRGQRAIFQGASGSGKSNGARLLLEATHGQFQHLILDVEDEFHTLRDEGRDYAILGGDHGDAPLSSSQDASDLARTLLKIGVSTVLQIGDWPLDEKRSFVGRFVAGMMRAKSDLWHPTIVMVDEAHLLIPQQGVVESSHAITHLATAGRKRGFSAIFATQRLSLIHKDVLAQCENKFLGRVEQSADRRAVADLLGFGSRSEEAVDMQAFRPGEFYVVGPAVSNLPRRARLYKAETETPPPGTTVLPSATPAAISKALTALAAAAESKKPEAGDSRGATTVTRSPDPKEIAAAEERGYARGFKTGRAQGLSVGFRLIEGIESAVHLAKHDKAFIEPDERESGSPGGLAPIPKERIETANAEVIDRFQERSTFSDRMSPSAVKLVDAIVAAYPVGLTLETAAKRAGLSKRSSAFRKYLDQAAGSSRIQRREDGRYVAVAREDGIAAPAGLEAFKAKLPPSYAAMLSAVERFGGGEINLDTIADLAGVSRTSSGLTSGLRELVALGLVDKTPQGYALSQDFVE